MAITPDNACCQFRLASPFSAGVSKSSAVAMPTHANAMVPSFTELSGKRYVIPTRISNAVPSNTRFTQTLSNGTLASICNAAAISISAAPIASIAVAAAAFSIEFLPSRYIAPASSASPTLITTKPLPPSDFTAFPISAAAAAITVNAALAVSIALAAFFIRVGLSFSPDSTPSATATSAIMTAAPISPVFRLSPRLAKIATAPAAISRALPIALMAISIPPSFTRYLMILSIVFSFALPESFCAKPDATISTLMAMATPLMAFTAPSMSRPLSSAFASGISASAIISTAAAAATNPLAPVTPPSCLLNKAISPVIPASTAAMCPTASMLFSSRRASIFPSLDTALVSTAIPMLIAVTVPSSFAVSSPVRSAFPSTRRATTIPNNVVRTLTSACTAITGLSILLSKYILALIMPTAVAMPFAVETKLFVVCSFVQASTAPFMLVSRSVSGFAIIFFIELFRLLSAFATP